VSDAIPTNHLRYFISTGKDEPNKFYLRQWWAFAAGGGEWRGIDGRDVSAPDAKAPPSGV
jgi:hypothetical protein